MNPLKIFTLLGFGLIISSSVARADDIFTFAGFSFDQRNTPNQGTRLGNSANHGSAIFSPGFASQVTLLIENFPQTANLGFNTNLSVAQLSGLKSGLYAVNLPFGNDGTSTRHGIEVWWSNGRGIENLPGKDFVIFESASSIAAVEGLMARVRTNWFTGEWTEWYYFAPTNFQITTGSEGIHSFSFDASGMGVAEGARFDRIQMANLTQGDRISGSSTNTGGSLVGEGKVVFDGSTAVFPDAGIFDSDRVFNAIQFDPDPLYLASFCLPCEVVAPQLSISRAGSQANLTWPAPSCFTLQTTTNLFATPIVWSPMNNTITQSNGFNVVTVTSTNRARFFRLVEP